METTPEYDQAIASLKRGTLSKNDGGEKAEQRVGQAYRHMQRLDPRWPRLREKYKGLAYKSAGTGSKGSQSQPKKKRWLGKNAPKGAGSGN